MGAMPQRGVQDNDEHVFGSLSPRPEICWSDAQLWYINYDYNYNKYKIKIILLNLGNRLDRLVLALLSRDRIQSFKYLRATIFDSSDNYRSQERERDCRKSEALSQDCIEELSQFQFVVQSASTNNDEYLIEVMDPPEQCRGSLCGLRCTRCRFCAHQLRCTCPFYAFGRDTCKHVHLIGRFLFRTGRSLLPERTEDAVQNRASQLYSDIVQEFCPENQPPNSQEQELKLKAKKQALLQLVGQMRLLVEKISSPAANTCHATASLCAAIDDLKAISGPSLAPLSGRPLAPTSGVEKQNFFPLKPRRGHLEDFPQPSLLEKQEILKLLFGESDKVVISEFLSEHTYAADAPVQFGDLTKEELNLLKLTVDADFLRVFLKQLRKGTFRPIEEMGLAENEDLLNAPSWPILLQRINLKRVLRALFSPSAFSVLQSTFEDAFNHWKCTSCQLVTEDRMIGCDYCNQWFHYKCQNVKRAPKKDFQCNNCVLNTLS